VEPRRAVYLLQQVCHSLGEAHARGLIHRDVKPANIMVCRLGPDDDFVKVLDFGLVKQTAKGRTVTMLSIDGTVVGTPSFMAPEVAQARSDVDGRADIYSLGCVGYYMLTGQQVFAGATPLATVLAHVQEAPVPLRLRSAFQLPPALEELVMQCLAKDPADRPPSIDAVRTRLAASVPGHAWTQAEAHLWWNAHQPGGFRSASTDGDNAVAGGVRPRRAAAAMVVD
jgi:serine/threonine-protein kinase